MRARGKAFFAQRQYHLDLAGSLEELSGGQRGNRTPDTRIFNGVLQNLFLLFNRLCLKNSSVLQNVFQRHGQDQKLAYLKRVD